MSFGHLNLGLRFSIVSTLQTEPSRQGLEASYTCLFVISPLIHSGVSRLLMHVYHNIVKLLCFLALVIAT